MTYQINLLDFNAIDFLSLNHLSSQDQEQLKPKLEEQIKEYLLIRLLDQLPPDFNEKKLKGVTASDQLVSLLKINFPDIEKK